jgi:drug/metabolite transporter (DMT)-like permease
MNKNKFITSILLILISLVWAGSFIAVRIIYTEISPINLGFLRFLIATPIMILILAFKKKKTSITTNEILPLAILGLTGVTLLYIFQFIGISFTTASTSAVLINTNVIFIAILSAIFIKEKFSIKKSIGVLLSFLGVILVLIVQISNENIEFNVTYFIGSIFIILSAICWSIYSIIGKRLLKIYDSFTITTYAFTIGTIFFIPFVFPNILYIFNNISIIGWIVILYLGVICSVFAYLAWYYVLSKNEAGKSAIFLNLIPLFTIIFSFFIGEKPTFLFLMGAILILYGVFLVQKN